MEVSKYQLCFINDHVVTKIVKAQLVVCHISNITVICFPALLRLHAVQYNTYRKPKELMNLSHPLSITLCQVIVNCYNMYTFSFQSI